MISQVRSNTNCPYTIFLFFTALLLIVIGMLLILIPKGELHLMLCQFHTPFLDSLIPIYTNLVDWLPYLIVVMLLFYRAGWATFLGSNLLLSTMIVQPIKHIVDAPRPLIWFADNMPDITLPLVEGVKMNHWLSFPSGHTTTFFVLFFTLSIILCAENIKGKKILSFICFLCASLGSYTRIYLSQHFALDVFAGILIAVCSTLVLYFFLVKKTKNTHFWAWRVQKLRK